MTLKEIADQFESCGYVCEAGKLEMNEAFIALRKYALQEQPNEAVDRQADVEEYEEMTIEAAIKHCEEVSRRSPCTPCEREHMRLAAWLTELVSLRAQQKQPNEPLTLEELREMDGEPVWLETGEVSIQEAIVGCWEILERVALYPVEAFWFTRRAMGFTEINYRKTWLAYRRKPEQEKKEQIHDSD